MKLTKELKLILSLTIPLTLIIIFLTLTILYLYFTKKPPQTQQQQLNNIESTTTNPKKEKPLSSTEGLLTFTGGENLTVSDILDAPGEVIGKSNHGTLYKALVQSTNSVKLLRFLRPVCTTNKGKEFEDVVRCLGCVRHPNLVPLLGIYMGPRGERLLVHPFYRRGSLAHFVKEGDEDSHKWINIYTISIGIAYGLDYLHTGLQKPIVNGNLKSKNILLGHNYQPHISDFGLHLLLNPTAGQEMLEASAAEGYKAPELMKMKDASPETDIYSLGITFLELLSGRKPISENPAPDEDFYLPTFMRNAVLDNRIADLYHPDILIQCNGSDDRGSVSEEVIIKYFDLAMSCCSASPSLRPNIKQVIKKLIEIGPQ
ncbi:hypothetical protein ACFE04_028823 [Oxalis oulophora]